MVIMNPIEKQPKRAEFMLACKSNGCPLWMIKVKCKGLICDWLLRNRTYATRLRAFDDELNGLVKWRPVILTVVHER